MSRARRGWILLPVLVAVAAEHDAVDVLARFGEMVKSSASMPAYRCVETIERQYYRARTTRTPRNCDDLAGEKKRPGYKLTLESTDRLRLEVRAGVGEELYSWPGADRVDERDLWDIIGYGPAATGPFIMSLLQVVQGDATDFAFQGESEVGGRKLFAYTFRAPQERSHYFIHMPLETIVTAWDGTVLLDPETSEVARMTSRTSELPEEAFACEIRTTSDYGHVTVDGRTFPLAQETRQRFIARSGEEIESVVTFSACQQVTEQRGRAEVEPGATSAGLTPAGAPYLDLPPGLPVTIELTTSIDSATAAAGDHFTGRLAKPVLDQRRKVLLAEGAVVSGRLIKVAAKMQPAEVALVLHVDTVQIDGAAVPLHLSGQEHGSQTGERLREILSSVTIGGSAGGNSSVGGVRLNSHPPASEEELDLLHFPGARKVLEAGFKTEWVTVSP